MSDYSDLCRESWDWEEALKVANRDSKTDVREGDLTEIIAVSEGENDGPDWLAVARHKDGRYVYVRAGCDYTGWG